MHLIIEFISKDSIILPKYYNSIIQGFIYKTLDEELSEFLHEKGYGTGRSFKLFACSNIMGKFDARSQPGYIRFGNRIKLEIASPVDKICESFASGLMKKRLLLGKNLVDVGSIAIDRQEVTSDTITVKTLSPVVTYSTLMKPDGKKYTCYFQPGEPDFQRICTENLRKKYTAYTNEEAPAGQVSIIPLSLPKLHIIKYRDTIIKGYSCTMELSGPKPLLQMAVDAGLGSKNAQCFGLIRLLERR